MEKIVQEEWPGGSGQPVTDWKREFGSGVPSQSATCHGYENGLGCGWLWQIKSISRVDLCGIHGSTSACGSWMRRELLHCGLFMECISAVHSELIGIALVGSRIMGTVMKGSD